jgi:hypothetical protein
MVDQPDTPMPHEHVRVPERAVDVGDVRVEPDDPGRQIRGRFLDDRIVCHRSREVVERQVDAGTVVDQRVDLGVGLRAGKVRIQSCEDQLRHGQPERPGELTRHELRDQSMDSMPAPRNFSTYSPSSSASTIAGSEPPSRRGVTYRVTLMVLSGSTATLWYARVSQRGGPALSAR